MFKNLGKNYTRYAVSCFGAFFVYALYFNIFGTNAAQMMAFFGTDSVRQGLILSVQAVGGISIAVVFTLFGDRFNKLKVLWRGIVLLAAASLAVGLLPFFFAQGGGYPMVLALVVFAGIGFTMTDIMMNASIPEVFGDQRNAVFPLVHASYSVGSMVSPAMTSLCIIASVPSSYALPFIICGVLCLAEFFFLRSAARKIIPDTPYTHRPAVRKKISWSDFAVVKNGRLWLFFLSGVFYFAFQICVSAWFPSYAVSVLGLTNTAGGLGVALFFAMSLVARITAPLLYRIISVRRYYIGLGALAGVVYFAGYASQNAVIMFAAMFVGGYLQGIMSPALISLCCEYFPENTSTASAAIILSINVAALAGPALAGKIAVSSGYTAAMLISAVWLTLAGLTVAPLYIKVKK